MSKYFPNNAAITAVPYEQGVETGHINAQNQTINPENGKYSKDDLEKMKKEGNWLPYIATSKGNVMIDPKAKGQMIVTNADGSMSIMSEKDLKASYSPAGKH